MTDFLKAVKADLTDRRLLPLVALVLVALVGAVAYAALGGGSSPQAPNAAVAQAPVLPPGLATSQTTPSAQQAIAETTNGAAAQRHGAARNPFAALPGSTKQSAAPSTTKTSGAGSASGSSTTTSSKTESAPNGGGESSTPASSPKPEKPKTLYKVALQFGVLPAGTTPGAAQLKSYAELVKATPLPSAKGRLIEFLGVTVTGSAATSATFALDSELLPEGSAVCLPSAVQCKVIDLKPGTSEQLVGVLPNGEAVTYELHVVSIESTKASSARVRSVLGAQARAVHSLLGQGGLLSLAGLHYASAGVLTFGGHPAFGARAHTSVRRARHSG